MIGKKEDLSTSARRKTVDTSVTWLKKTVYLTNDPFDPVHQFKSEQQTQVGRSVGWLVDRLVGRWMGGWVGGRGGGGGRLVGQKVVKESESNMGRNLESEETTTSGGSEDRKLTSIRKRAL